MTCFINYSSGQELYVTHFQQTLDRLVGANPYVAENIGAAGTKIHSKIKSMLDSSGCMISILTSDTLRDGTWQNQEIGYFEKMGRTIIPIKEEGFQIKGFLEGTEYITLKPYDLNQNSYELIARVRQVLRLYKYHVQCPNCGAAFDANLPPQKDINAAVQNGHVFTYNCFPCHYQIEIEPKCLGSLAARDIGYTPNYRFSNM